MSGIEFYPQKEFDEDMEEEDRWRKLENLCLVNDRLIS